MGKIRQDITILAIGDRADYDSYRKFHKEKAFILKSGFEYATTSYKRLLKRGTPPIRTEKVIVFLFFPFAYWNKYIEHRRYKGIYGNRVFFRKFSAFWNEVDKALSKSLGGRKIYFINKPFLCGFYRDKLNVAKRFRNAAIPTPGLCNVRRVRRIEKLLNEGRAFFLKPRFGSMGKGITFLSWSNWQTNFAFKNGRIISRKSDRGWKFREVTGNRTFLAELLKKDVLIEKAVDSLVIKRAKVDMRVYVFLDKVVYIYPRRNRMDRITTNISQGAKGDPRLLEKLPKHLVEKARLLAPRVSKALGLGFVGMDIMMDKNLKDIFVIDANIFSGFPKRKTFNLARCMVEELKRNRRGLSYESFGKDGRLDKKTG